MTIFSTQLFIPGWMWPNSLVWGSLRRGRSLRPEKMKRSGPNQGSLGRKGGLRLLACDPDATVARDLSALHACDQQSASEPAVTALVCPAGQRGRAEAMFRRAKPCFDNEVSAILARLRRSLRMGQAMGAHYSQSFRRMPRRIVLGIDDTFDAVHRGQQLRLFNAHYDEYGFQPIVVFDGDGRMIAAVLRPACRPSGRQIVKWLRWLLAALRAHWPRVEIMLRGDSHFCTPEVLRFCRANQLDYILGAAPTSMLRKHIAGLEQSAAARRPAQVAKSSVGSRNSTGWTGRCRYALHCHHPGRWIGSHPLSGCLLRTRAGRKSYQGVEDTSRGGSHVVLPGKCQSDATVSVCRRILVDVEPAFADAAASNPAIFALALSRLPRLFV